MKNKIINNPDQWIITLKGDFVRIKNSLTSIEENLEKIRQKLKTSRRFLEKSPEQIAKERYDKVLEEVNFDYNKLHDWIYDEKNRDKVEVIKKSELSYHDRNKVIGIITEYVEKTLKEKWRLKFLGKHNDYFREALINEETGQVFYYLPNQIGWLVYKQNLQIPYPKVIKSKEKHTATLIFLHGTYGAGSLDQMVNEFPGLKVIHPHSPTLQYDMWHGSRPAPGRQCKGWINITGDAWEIMENDVVPNNPSRINYKEVDQSIHLDYPQLMRAVSYVNEIIEREIADGIPSEKIFVSGYSQGGLLTLAVALTSQYKLGGFISLCGLLPRRDKLLKITQDKNKETPILIINNSKDSWIPFWTGEKTFEILKNRGYNVEFTTYYGLGHSWKNEDIVNFLKKCLSQKMQAEKKQALYPKNNFPIKTLTIIGISSLAVILVIFGIWLLKKGKKR